MNNRIIILLCLSLCALTYADQAYTKNRKANKLYSQGKYAEALTLYDEALLESPQEKRLAANKGSSQYRLNEFDAAEESYKSALAVQDPKVQADIHYNLGNLYNMQGDQLAQSGDQKAMDKYKAARDSYIKSLDLRQSDRDAKWNLQLTQMKIKQLEQQQKQQQDNKDNQDNKDKQNKDDQKQNQDQNQKQDQNKDKQDKQDNKEQQQDQQKQDEKKDQQQQQQQSQEQEQKDQQEKQQPQPKEQSKEDLQKEEALRLLMQYSDDDKDLNKPQKKIRAVGTKQPEKDW